MDKLLLLIGFFEPYLTEMIVTFVAGKLFQLLDGRLAQDTLHRAVETAVDRFRPALEDGRVTQDEVLDFVLSYVKRSSSGACKKLKADDSVIRDMTVSKIERKAMEARQATVSAVVNGTDRVEDAVKGLIKRIDSRIAG